MLQREMDLHLGYESNDLCYKDTDNSRIESNIKNDFDGNKIINPEEIVRNREFVVDVIVSDTLGRFEEKSIPVRVILYGDITNNKGYYTVTGVSAGADGNWWNTSGNVSITSNSNSDGGYVYRIAQRNISSAYGTELALKLSDPENYDTQHLFYVRNENDTVIYCREYFGFDGTAPVISGVEYSEGVVLTPYGRFSDGDVTIKVMADDAEGNLYGAAMKIDGKEDISADFVADDQGNKYFEFVLSKEDYKGLNANIKIAVFDAAGNTAYETVGNLVIEDGEATANLAISESNESQICERDGKLWFNGDTKIDVTVTDLIPDSSEDEVSGLQSYDVYVNGTCIYQWRYLEQENPKEKVLTDTYEVYIKAQDYMDCEDNRVRVEVRNITDMAGNAGNNVEFCIYMDAKAPDITFTSVETDGGENRTAYSNFYNKSANFIFKLTDEGSGVYSAKLNIDDVVYNGSISDDGVVIFPVKVSECGNISITIMDKVGNSRVVNLRDIADVSGTKPFLSNYVLIEDEGVQMEFAKSCAATKGDWCRDTVKYTVSLAEKQDTDVPSSGIRNVKIYVNDKEYLTKTFTEKDVNTLSYDVIIDRQWIDSVINESGTYTVKAVVEDNAGNITKDAATVKIDVTAPVISDLTGVQAGSSNTGVVTVKFDVYEKHFSENGNKVTVKVQRELDGQVTTYEAEPFIYKSERSGQAYTFREDGTYTVTVESEDAAGNVAEAKSISFIIDNTAPLANITGVSENGYYVDRAKVRIDIIESNFTDTDISVSITRELNGEISVIQSRDFDSTQKESSLLQEFTEEGTYTIRVDAKDKAGNVALTKTVIFTVDTAAPTVDIVGVKDGMAYNGDISPKVSISDNYYRNYSVTLAKTGVYFNDGKTQVQSLKETDVTYAFMTGKRVVENGVEVELDAFDSVQKNDGIYTLTVSATDYAGRTTTKSVTFSVNRFGSVYTIDDNLRNIINTYKTSVDTDFVITEYNANKLVSDSIRVTITRDGSPIEDVLMDTFAENDGNAVGDSGWYQYRYVISKDNFVNDGIYEIAVSSADAAGNNSNIITYDELTVRFSVDTTKPEVVKVTGLRQDTYSADKIQVDYEVFDAVGLENVKVFLSGKCIQEVTEFTDVTTYAGSFTIKEGMEQHIRFQVEDKAGNVIDSDSADDLSLGKIVDFEDTITVSTNVFIRWYADKTLFYGTIAGASTMAVGGAAAGLAVRRRKIRARQSQ